MKKSLISIAALIALSASAQSNVTLPAGNTITGGSGTAGIITINATGNGNVIIKDSTTLEGNSTTVNSTYTSLNSTQTFVNGEKTVFNQQGTVTTINKNGVSTAGSVTAAKVYTQGMDVGNTLTNLTNSVNSKASANSVTNLTNTVEANRATAATATAVVQTNLDTETNARVAGDTALGARIDAEVERAEVAIEGLEDRKADKVAVTADIATAKTEAIASAATDATTKAGNAETNAKAHADAGDTDLNNRKADKSEVVAARTYTDEQVRQEAADRVEGDRQTLSSANAYTDSQIGQVRKEVNAVGAMAMAASVVGGVSVAEGKSTAVTAAVGNYGNATAIAVGVTHIVAPNKRVFATIGRASGSKTGVALGASFSF